MAHLAPETIQAAVQAQKVQTTAVADVWSLGVIAYELFTGKLGRVLVSR